MKSKMSESYSDEAYVNETLCEVHILRKKPSASRTIFNHISLSAVGRQPGQAWQQHRAVLLWLHNRCHGLHLDRQQSLWECQYEIHGFDVHIQSNAKHKKTCKEEFVFFTCCCSLLLCRSHVKWGFFLYCWTCVFFLRDKEKTHLHVMCWIS